MPTLRTLARPLVEVLAARMGWNRLQDDPGSFANVCDGVVELSRLFTRQRGDLGRNYLADGRWLRAYLAYFLPVNLAKIQALLDELPQDQADPQAAARPFRVLDVGSGPGTGALAVFDWLHRNSVQSRPLEAAIVDHTAASLHEAEAVWRSYIAATRFEDARLRCVRADVERPSWIASVPAGSYDVIVLANALNELFLHSSNPLERRAQFISVLLDRLDPSGALMIVEPALRETSRDLHALRDALLTRGLCSVYSPCLHEHPCPALFKKEDWCHEERRWRPPPWIEVIDGVVGFIKDALKFSYLILRRDGRTIVPRDDAAFRVVSEVRVMKGDVRAWLCSAQGRSDVGRLDRERSDLNQGVDEWHRGAIVRLTNVDWKPSNKYGIHTGRVRKRSGAGVLRQGDR
jgi:ribosomal protein RSM22 (predicted rRNA methylase)